MKSAAISISEFDGIRIDRGREAARIIFIGRIKQPFSNRVRWIALLTVTLLMTTGCTYLPIRRGDPSGTQVARSILKAMGGARTINKINYLRFDFVVEDQGVEQLRRSHTWDRRTGRYRLEDKSNGQPRVTLFNVHTRQGRSWLGVSNNLRPDPDPQAVETAYAQFINDSYWLLAATKLRDPGTHLEFAGEQQIEDRAWPTLKLWFDEGVGLTPKDVYWFHIDPTTGRPYAWSFVLKGQQTPPRTFIWTHWQAVRKLMLPTRFEELGHRERAIVINPVYTPAEIRDELFEKP